jgi:dienelactone hydrolase
VRHLQPGTKIAAGFNTHPSFVTGNDPRAIKGPLAIAAAEADVIFPAETRHASETILKETGLPYPITLFNGVAHG